MEQEIPPIINPDELILLNQTSEIVIVDARTGIDAKAKYLNQHLDGALYVDLDTELANIKPDVSNGGRHPLPKPDEFSNVLTLLGITTSSHVIIYDDKNASNAAARFWWMLKSIGHKRVQVINGGFNAAINAGFPITHKEEHALMGKPYGDIKWILPLSNMKEVERAALDDNSLIIDVRDKERFNGEKETIDLIAGHIPGAINIPFTANLDTQGFFLSPEKLRNMYLEIIKERNSENIIVHCGSGVTACHTLLAMAYAGLQIPKLYVGSWSEWSRNNKPIATR